MKLHKITQIIIIIFAALILFFYCIYCMNVDGFYVYILIYDNNKIFSKKEKASGGRNGTEEGTTKGGINDHKEEWRGGE